MSTVPLLGADAINAAIRMGNVNIAGSMQVEVMDLNSDSKDEQRRHAEILRKYEAQRKGRSIILPTAIEDVKAKLREMGQPVTLFGEGHADRRDRLRDIIGALELGDEELKKMQEIINQKSLCVVSTAASSSTTTTGQPIESAKVNPKEIFYSPASDALIEARKFICEFSFKRAQSRIAHTKRLREEDEQTTAENQAVLSLYKTCGEIVLNSSQCGDDRPLTCIRFSPDGNFLATSSLASTVKLWNADSCSLVTTLRGHEERITDLAWYSDAGSTIASSSPPSSSALLAVTSADATCTIWRCGGSDEGVNHCMDVVGDESAHRTSGNGGMQEEQRTGALSCNRVHTLKRHQGVVSACDFHPSGRYVATGSHDYTWRLWDVETGTELLLQDGHSKECSTLSFHIDGSLILTADFAGVALIWDIRSGQQIQAFQGHAKKITSSCFSPNGFQAATGGTDNMVRIWDLRKRKCSYVLPAHTDVISEVRYSMSGEVLLTSSFDATVKLWGARDHRLLQSLSGHVGKVMASDISPKDEKHVISAGYDRTFKLWSHRDEY